MGFLKVVNNSNVDPFYLFPALCESLVIGAMEMSKLRGHQPLPLSKTRGPFSRLWAGKSEGNLGYVTFPRKTLSTNGQMASEGQIFLKSNGVQIRAVYHYGELQSCPLINLILAMPLWIPVLPSFHSLGNIRISEDEYLKVFIAV